MGLQVHTKFQRNRPNRYRVTASGTFEGNGCARAHVRMHSTNQWRNQDFISEGSELWDRAPPNPERAPKKPERPLQSKSGSLQMQSGPSKARAGPTKARAGPCKARAGPSKARAAPPRQERAPPKPERPLERQSGPLKKPERAPPDISEGSADPFDPPPPGCATATNDLWKALS